MMAKVIVGHHDACGHEDQEVQQPPRPPCHQHNKRSYGGAQPEARLRNAPTYDLRQKINKVHDARDIIEARKKDREKGRCDVNKSDRFSAFTANITDCS